MAEYAGPETLKAAAHAVREAGFKRFDTFAPYPIHGMPKALGQKYSQVGIFCL